MVNFVTDKRFEGFKANISAGVSNYGDNTGGTVQMAAGTTFLGGRGHFQVAAEYSHTDGVGITQKLGCCEDALAGGRDWFTQPTRLQYSSPGATPAGQPQYFNVFKGQHYQLARYGMITNGSKQGTAFLDNGTPYQFDYGYGLNGLKGVPVGNSAGTVTNCINPFCIGGQTDGMIGAGVTLAFPLTRGGIYSRVSYEITPDINVWATLNWASVATSNIPNPDAWRTDVTIRCDNAFLPGTGIFGQGLTAAQTQAACLTAYPLATYPNGMGFGSDFHNLGPQTVYTLRNQRRAVVGADGAFNLLGSDWTWSTYFQHGENNTHIKVRMITMKPHLNAALDSIIDPATNAIVCRDTFARQNGCLPFNPFGNVEPSEGQKDYLYGGALYGPGPYQKSFQKEDAFSLSFNGTPFENWAGKVSIATGIEYRDESYYVYGDAGGNGAKFVPGVPFNQCVSPQVNSTGGARFDCVNGVNWYAGSFHNGKGNYHVQEGFVEAVVPLINSPEFGRADFDIAGRMAGYSTAGQAITWKLGLTYDTPLDGVRVRALQSRDVRAPNLSELFAAPVTANGTQQNPWTGVQNQVVNATLGNPLLRPERSLNTQVGVVFQPSWLAGFRFSADYYRIGLKGQVGNVNGASSVNYCFQGLTQYCSALIYTGTLSTTGNPVLTRTNAVAYNIASTVTDGFNYEASYQFDLQDWDIPGEFVIREMATNVSNFTTNPGLPGQIPLQSAGTNDGSIPHWKIFGTQTYSTDRFSITLSETWISQGVHNRAWIQCAPGSCPVPTVNNPTINDNHVPGIFYLNLGANYNLDDNWKLYVQVDNLLNKSPPPFYANSQNPTANGANTFLYDVIGRMFRFGVRIQN